MQWCNGGTIISENSRTWSCEFLRFECLINKHYRLLNAWEYDSIVDCPRYLSELSEQIYQIPLVLEVKIRNPARSWNTVLTSDLLTDC